MADIKLPWVAGHRGGANIYPEHSLEAYRATSDAGFIPEVDLYKLADGRYACIHDATVNRTMVGVTGNVSALTSAEFKRGKVKNPIPGGDYGTPVLFDELLEEFGGRPLLIEAKVASEGFEIVAAIQAKGLTESVILASFDFTTAKYMAEQGISTMYLFQGTPDKNAAQTKAAGIEYAGISRGTAQSTFDSFKNAGIKMATWTIDDPDAMEFDANRGAVGFITDDPWYCSGQDRKLTGDPFAKRFAYPGWQEGITNADVVDNNKGRLWSFLNAKRGEISVKRNPVAARTRSLTQSWAGIINGDFTIRAKLTYGDDSASDTRWLGMFVGCGKGKAVTGPDAVWRDESTAIVPQQFGYGVLWRRNGQIAIYRNDHGAPVLLGTGQSVARGDNQSRNVEFKRVGNTFTATDLDTGDQCVVSSGTYGGDQFLALAANGTSGFVSGVSVS